MALDGIVISSLVHELNTTILGLKISKIAQPEADELLLTIKGNSTQHRLCLSASASLPFAYLNGTAYCADVLYGAAQAHCKRQDHPHLPAGA